MSGIAAPGGAAGARAANAGGAPAGASVVAASAPMIPIAVFERGLRACVIIPPWTSPLVLGPVVPRRGAGVAPIGSAAGSTVAVDVVVELLPVLADGIVERAALRAVLQRVADDGDLVA